VGLLLPRPGGGSSRPSQPKGFTPPPPFVLSPHLPTLSPLFPAPYSTFPHLHPLPQILTFYIGKMEVELKQALIDSAMLLRTFTSSTTTAAGTPNREHYTPPALQRLKDSILNFQGLFLFLFFMFFCLVLFILFYFFGCFVLFCFVLFCLFVCVKVIKRAQSNSPRLGDTGRVGPRAHICSLYPPPLHNQVEAIYI
jgi:hypothetical protein